MSMFPPYSDPYLDDAGKSALPRKYTKRQQTLMDLVQLLLQAENPKAEELVSGITDRPKFEDDGDFPTVDERLQASGADSFHKFEKRLHNLDKELRNFANASRQLGSSIGLLSSATGLRKRLAQVLHLFHSNASDIFPRKITKKEPVLDTPRVTKIRKRRTKTPHLVQQPVIDDNLDVEQFPLELELLAVDVGTFLVCLDEFPEFTDEAIHASIEAFQGDLKYWASCLEEYQGQFRYPAVQRYIHDLSSEMGEHIDNITATLKIFIEIGVPTIRFAQKHGTNNLLNLSTVATFFSAVTATTLQFSFSGLEPSAVTDAVNIFWFSSLVFSIAAAVNSLLGLTWKQAMYRSPFNRVPWWVLIWIKRSPLVFLVMSVACFSIGLCCFSYASKQNAVTSIFTTVLTAITSFGLAAVSAWFASERWVYSHHQGRKWLADVLADTGYRLSRNPAVDLMARSLTRMVSSTRRIRLKVSSCMSWLRRFDSDSESNADDLEYGTVGGSSSILPMINPHAASEASSSPLQNGKPMSPSRFRRPSETENARSFTGEPSEKFDENVSPISPTFGAPPNSPTMPSVGKQLWRNALNTVKMHAALMPNTRGTPVRKRTKSSSLSGPNTDRSRTMTEDHRRGPRLLKSRVAGLVPRLNTLDTTQDLAVHTALVRHLQFSPDGKYLATSSWDRTSRILAVDEDFRDHRVLAHARGFVGQVAWSPDGELLLTKLNRGFKIWTKDGVCQRTIDRKQFVQSVTWFPGGQAFMSVEGSEVVKLDLLGQELCRYPFVRMKLHDVAVTIDGERVLGVGTLLESMKGLRPSKSRPENRLVVYNLDTGQCENQTPVINDVRDITLSKNGQSALVSYENKAPPQLWRLELIKERDSSSQTCRLTLRHSYMPEAVVDFAGPSYFGGKNDELVLCAAKSGDIHIWDTESGALLRHVRAQTLGGELTCIAWNHAVDDPFMFATGCHDGTVRIWTKPVATEENADGRTTPYETDMLTNSTNSNVISRTESPIQFSGRLQDSPIQERSESIHETDSRSVAFAVDTIDHASSSRT